MLRMQRTGPFIANLPPENPKIQVTYFELQTYVGIGDWIGWREASGGVQEHVNQGPQGDVGLVSETEVNYPDKGTPPQTSTQPATTTVTQPYWTQKNNKATTQLDRWNTEKV